MLNKLFSILCVIAVIMVSGCDLCQCEPRFLIKHSEHGAWLGGDGAHSVMLSENSVFWVFGDSFVNEKNEFIRKGPLVTNTVAYGSCQDDVYDIDYQWLLDENNHPKPVFALEGHIFWVRQPVLYRGMMFVPLADIELTPGTGLGWVLVGTYLARVRNPYASIFEWQIDYLPFYDGPSAVGHGVVIKGKYMYLYVAKAIANGSENYLARLPLKKLINLEVNDARGFLEYYAKDKTWKSGYNEGDAQPMGFAADSGSTFFFNKTLGKWQVVYYDTNWEILPDNHFVPGNRIDTRISDNLTGPWSEARLAYEVPETTPGSIKYDEEFCCYAGFVHPELSCEPDQELVITYNCSVINNLPKLINYGQPVTEDTVVVPRVVRVNNPFNNQPDP